MCEPPTARPATCTPANLATTSTSEPVVLDNSKNERTEPSAIPTGTVAEADHMPPPKPPSQSEENSVLVFGHKASHLKRNVRQRRIIDEDASTLPESPSAASGSRLPESPSVPDSTSVGFPEVDDSSVDLEHRSTKKQKPRLVSINKPKNGTRPRKKRLVRDEDDLDPPAPPKLALDWFCEAENLNVDELERMQAVDPEARQKLECEVIEKWKSLSNEMQKKFVQQADEDKERYQEELNKWRAAKGAHMQAKTGKQRSAPKPKSQPRKPAPRKPRSAFGFFVQQRLKQRKQEGNVQQAAEAKESTDTSVLKEEDGLLDVNMQGVEKSGDLDCVTGSIDKRSEVIEKAKSDDEAVKIESDGDQPSSAKGSQKARAQANLKAMLSIRKEWGATSQSEREEFLRLEVEDEERFLQEYETWAKDCRDAGHEVKPVDLIWKRRPKGKQKKSKDKNGEAFGHKSLKRRRRKGQEPGFREGFGEKRSGKAREGKTSGIARKRRQTKLIDRDPSPERPRSAYWYFCNHPKWLDGLPKATDANVVDGKASTKMAEEGFDTDPSVTIVAEATRSTNGHSGNSKAVSADAKPADAFSILMEGLEEGDGDAARPNSADKDAEIAPTSIVDVAATDLEQKVDTADVAVVASEDTAVDQQQPASESTDKSKKRRSELSEHARTWAKLNDTEREHYVDLATKDKLRYHREYVSWSDRLQAEGKEVPPPRKSIINAGEICVTGDRNEKMSMILYACSLSYPGAAARKAASVLPVQDASRDETESLNGLPITSVEARDADNVDDTFMDDLLGRFDLGEGADVGQDKSTVGLVDKENMEEAMLVDSFGAGQDLLESDFGPQLQLDEQGNIILNQESLKMHTSNSTVPLTSAPIRQTVSAYERAYKKGQRCKWSDEETEDFYKALSIYGTDLFLVQTFFRDKSAAQVKSKFKIEERNNPKRIQEVLTTGSKRLTRDTFELLHGKIDTSKHYQTPAEGEEDDFDDVGEAPASPVQDDMPDPFAAPSGIPEARAPPGFFDAGPGPTDENETTDRLMSLFD